MVDQVHKTGSSKWRLGAVLLPAAVAGAYLAYVELSTDRSEADRLADALELKKDDVLAEIGAGNGKMAVSLTERTGIPAIVTETDARKLARFRKRGGFIVVEAGQHSTNLEANCCNAVLIRHVYHHFTDPAGTVASLFRAVRPGGRVAVVDSYRKLWYLPKPSGVPDSRKGHGIPLALLIEEMQRAGFELLLTNEQFSRGAYLAVFRKP